MYFHFAFILHTAIETVLQAGLNYLFRHKMNSLPGQPIKTAWASSFNAWTNSLQYCLYSCVNYLQKFSELVRNPLVEPSKLTNKIFVIIFLLNEPNRNCILDNCIKPLTAILVTDHSLAHSWVHLVLTLYLRSRNCHFIKASY